MAGIGFELRKLYRKQGLLANLQAYSYSTIITVGPMILCLTLVIVEQILMNYYTPTSDDKDLFMATLAYCFVFSIIVTSSLSMIVTRYIADKIYEKSYGHIMSAYYGSFLIIIPITACIAILFLSKVDESLFYKVNAYFLFLLLVIIWMQNVFMSALKDYKRIFNSFLFAIIIASVVALSLYTFVNWQPILIALLSMNTGFLSIVIFSNWHFERVFPKSDFQQLLGFFNIVKKYPFLIISGLFVYSSVYIHNLVYWFLNDDPLIVAEQFKLMPFYDVAVFFAYITVLPSLITFVVIIETDFYEKFVIFYRNVTQGGTIEALNEAKTKLQKITFFRLTLLAETQLLFTILGIALGIMYLPRIGFTSTQIDVFITLCFAYFFFIIFFVILHLIMYFDDQKGVLALASSFVILSAVLTYVTMILGLHGFGLFIASFIVLGATIWRLYFILNNIQYYTYCPQPVISMKQTAKSKASVTVVSLLALFFLAGCVDSSTESDSQQMNEGEQLPTISPSQQITIDDKRIYERDDDASLTTLYITILPDKNNPELDWYGLNRIVDRYSEESLDIIIAEGAPDGSGPIDGLFGGGTASNAKISLRGNSARNFPQKSYKINLKDSAGIWNDQKTINLNKHIGDNSRLLNKLSFDLMETIPTITSLRTQFIQLYVKDLTANETTYTNYGLYTHVEQPNKRFLRNHLLDENGYLYKVTFFEFNRYPDQIKLESDPTYSKEAFETILEIKGREEHRKLIQLLNDINNYSLDINDVVNYHFVEENFLTWLAINLLMDNMDTDANNFFLYSPINNEKWLIIPWDYDDAWEQGRTNMNFDPFRGGISNFWGNTLINRYLRYDKNVEKLTAKMNELHDNYINESTVSNLINQYGHIPQQFVQTLPDAQYLRTEASNYPLELERIKQTPANALKRYMDDLQKPKPFYIAREAQVDGNETVFSWEPSYDFQGDSLFYTATLATDPTMQNVVKKVESTPYTQLKVENLQAGSYYLQVTVEDANGNKMSAFDQYRDESGEYYFGIVRLEVDR